MNMTPFEAFSKYEAIKLHFSSDDYDFFKYHGKTRINQNSFNGRSDKIFFQILAKRYNDEEYEKFLVANFLHDSATWVRELTNDNAKKTFTDYQKKMQALSYNFRQDMEFALRGYTNPNELLAVNKDKGYPALLQIYKEGDISLETIIILDMILGFLPMWNRRITDTVIWPRIYRKITKYRPFLSIDIEKYKKIAKEALYA